MDIMIFKNYEEYKKKISEIKEKLKGKYGCILTLSGYVREYNLKEGKKIPTTKLVIDKKVIDKIKHLSNIAKEKYGVLEVIIFHNYGELKVGEQITEITIFSAHRYEAMDALNFIINEIKKYH